MTVQNQTEDQFEDQPVTFVCGCCGGSGWVVRDADIGTDQECFVCEGTGEYDESD